MLLPQEIIRAKRNKQTLSEQEIQAFVDGLVDGSFNDAQVGAMAMAIYQNSMNTEETVFFTQAMKNSGSVMSWDELDGPVVDKHSTGGVGDKVSFMLAAGVAACGAYIPMISGRGLGHTGGTVDKLQSISGFNVTPTNEEFKRVVKEHNLAIIAQTSDLAPADKKLYSIRDITATVESIPLITASILSKKLAAGLGSLVMDIKVGNGAMMNNLEDAKVLGQTIVDVATGAGVPTEAIITDMNQPLGYSAGNAIEMAETVDYLNGTAREPRLHEVVCQLGASMLKSSGLATDTENGLAMMQDAFDSGRAAKVFGNMIHALGGPEDFMQQPWNSMPKAPVIREIKAVESGYIASVDTRGIGMSVVAMGGGRVDPSQLVDHSVGFDQFLPLGTYVNAGDTIARIHAVNDAMADQAEQEFISHYQFSATKPELAPEIYTTLTPSKPA